MPSRERRSASKPLALAPMAVRVSLAMPAGLYQPDAVSPTRAIPFETGARHEDRPSTGLARGGQLDPERRTPAHHAGGRDRPAVRRHDGVADREPESHSLPGHAIREEGIEDPLQEGGLDARAVVD